jgi:hypothetical protein
MKIKYLLLSLILLTASISLISAKTIFKGKTKDDVKIKLEREFGELGDNEYQFEIEATKIDEPICVTGTIERLVTYETEPYVAKVQNPEIPNTWCYFFPKGKTPKLNE